MNKNFKKITAGILSTALATSLCLGSVVTNVSAATEHWNDATVTTTSWTNWKNNWDKFSSDYERVSLTPGKSETELNFAWYCKTTETPKVQISKNEDMSGAVEFVGAQQDAVVISKVQYYSNKVVVTGLEENTTYYYQVYKNGDWAEKQTYATKSFSNFSFLYVGDPQIGASEGQTSTDGESMSNAGNVVTTTAESNLAARNDSYNWNNVLNNAVADNAQVSFMVSAGDQVNYGKNEREYSSYLGAEALRSLPVSTTIGNHDSSSNQYSLHYNNPNAFDETQTEYATGKTAAGTDYYYTYGDVLFIVLDTNNYNCATHENVIKKATQENPDKKWRVVTFHQDIYGSGYDHSDSDGMVLRTQLTPIMDEYNIDVVLQGHDHTYSRTYQLQGDGNAHDSFDNTNYRDDNEKFLEQNNNCYQIVNDTKSGTVVNPEGTVYFEANSATGSKFYNLIATQQNYISERSQSWTPTYSVVEVTNDTFSVVVYDATTRQPLENSSEYTIVKKANPTDTTITATTNYTKTLGDKAFSLEATADSDATLSYASTNEDVAVVSSTGKVTLTGVGTTTIKVSAAATETKNAAEKEISIVVNAPAKAQTISASSAYTKVYGSKSFKLNAKAQTKLYYSSSNKSIATVSSTGVVSLKGIGYATITVKAASSDKFLGSYKKVSVKVLPKKANLKSVNSSAKKFKATWTRDSKASGYQVIFATNKSFTSNVTTVKISKNSQTSYLSRTLTKGKTYYVKVLSYKNVSSSKLLGATSTVKRVKIK